MQTGRSLQPLLRVLGTGRRRTLIVGTILAAVVAGVIVPLASGGGPAATPSRIFRSEGCALAPEIDAPSGGKGVGPWRKLPVPAENTCATLTPTARDTSGISQNASFVFTAAQAIDAATIGRRLTATPAIAFDVRSESPTRHRIVPRSPLAESTVYRFALLDAPGGKPLARWAFQTHGPLRVVETLPGNEATDVPLNLGIELTFSHDGVTGVEKHFAISPKTDGRFEIHKRVVVFVPKQLRARTLYTVTLRPGVGIEGSRERIERPFTFRFETGSEERSGDTPGAPALQFGRAVWESATADAPVVSLFFSNGASPSGAPRTVPFTVYRYDGVDGFLEGLGRFNAVPSWAGYTRASFVASTKGLSKIMAFTGRLQRLDEEGDLFVSFPSALAPGFYLVRTEYADVPIQTWLQVTDVATYAALSDQRTLVWVNDVSSKKPMAGARLRVAGGNVAASTASDGTASFRTPRDLLRLRPDDLGQSAEVVGNLIVTTDDGRIAVVPLADIFSGFHSFEFREYTFAGDPTPYWRFLYADRNLYRPSDAIRFWGLVRRRAGAARQQDVTVEMVGGSDELAQGQTVATTTVRTSSRGTFIGELPFTAASPGYYELVARVGDQTIASTTFEVEDFVKPAYKIDVVPSKRAVVSGEGIRFDIRASFFEGSPVPNLGLTYELGYDEAGRKAIRTDAEGGASVGYRKRTAEFLSEQLRVFPTLAEEGEITGSATVQVYPSTVGLEAEGIFLKDRARVDGSVYNIEFDKLNSDENFDPYDSSSRPPAPGRRVTAAVTEVSWRRVEEGETYDFVAKIVQKKYRYVEVRRARGNFSDTSDGRGRFSFSFPAGPKRDYEVDLSVDDSAGRTARTTTWVHTGFDVSSSFPYVTSLTEGPYAVGETVSVAMRSGPADLPSGGDNRYLFYKAAGGIRNASVLTTPRFSFRFSTGDVPTIHVVAVRFDGITYSEAVSAYQADFDAELRRLTITVSASKARYRPHETADLAVRVTDNRGRPVRAEVLLSAVDEALFRVHPSSFYADRNILETLYEPVQSGVLHAYASHQYPNPFDGAEMGGEGADRTDFRDVGIFTRVVTDADGRATAPFELPDNLTSWRITTLAVSDRLEAGSATTLVPVGLPVFADVGLNDSYLVTDRPSVRLRAFGTDLRAGDDAAFRVEAPSLISKPITATGKAFRPVDVALPPLREGRHRISVTVSTGSGRDTLVRTITVVPSRLLHVEARTDELAVGGRFIPGGVADRPTTLVLSDRNRGRYYPALEELSWTYGDRLDQMLARNLAQELLGRYFGEPAPFPALFRPSAYQTDEGGIAIFPFADDDLGLSANVAALVPDRFGRQHLITYFSSVLADPEQTRERGIVALYGMASLGEPVLVDVQRAAAEDDLSLRERLYVALAALELGDEPTARTIYRDVLRRHAEVRGGTVRLDTGRDEDDILEPTSLAAVLGAGLADDAAAAMFDYVASNRTRDVLVGLNEIAYLSTALPRLPEEASRVAYTLGGKRETRELSRGTSVALTLTATQRATLNLEVLQGRIGVSTSYLAPFRPEDVRSDPDARITRNWNGSEKGGTRRLRESDLVRIQIAYRLGGKAQDGCYQITDILPSGLRAVTQPYDRGIEDDEVSYPYAIEGQRVSFCVAKGGLQRPIVYYARVIGRGTFTAEQAMIQSQRAPERASLTGTLRVEIT